MQLIYCNFFLSFYPHSDILRKQEYVLREEKKNSWERVSMQPAFKRITFETTGDNVMNCKFAFWLYSP